LPRPTEEGAVKDYIIPFIAILAWTALEPIALLRNINGALLATVVAAIAGIAGYKINAIRNRRKTK